MYHYLKIAAISVLIFGANNMARSTHLLGGELSWECIKSGSNSGKYVFHLSLYRNCGGAGLGNSQSILGPTGSVALTLDTVILLNEACWDSNATIYCIGTTASKAIEHYIYLSAPYVLTGTPPASGWEFFWTSCCRPNSPIMDNLHPQNQSYRLSAKMFPYTPPGYLNPLPINNCYDSSPEFAQSPEGVVCKGINTKLNNSAFDAENDILKYSFTYAKQSNGSTVTYATHHSTSQTMPRLFGGGFIVPSP